ncbi:MAG: GIY-YIG nuclease family protein, partial [Cryomorphaceae bacterium]|nr:GIY-YIG nuclease family protein [Cryomorphaceae bacterium]
MYDFVTYILISSAHNKVYVGFTSDLINRMKSHNLYSTKGYTTK